MPEQSAVDLQYLDQMAGGNPQIRQLLLTTMVDELERDIPRTRPLVEQQSWKDLAAHCHHLKNTLGFTGNALILQANNELWDIAKQNGTSDSSQLESTLNTLEEWGQKIIDEVKALL